MLEQKERIVGADRRFERFPRNLRDYSERGIDQFAAHPPLLDGLLHCLTRKALNPFDARLRPASALDQ